MHRDLTATPFLEHLVHRHAPQATGASRVRVVLLLEALLAGGLQVVTAHSDDIVTAVGGGVIDRLVLAHQEEGDGGSKPAETARVGADVDMVPGPRVGETGLYQDKVLALSKFRSDERVQCMCCNVDMSSQIATAVAHCKQGKGLIKVNGQPLSLVQPEILRFKVYEPLLIVGADKFAGVDIRVRVSGGGHTSQVYAIRQAIAKSLVAYYQKYVDEHSKNQLKQALVQYDRTLLVADNRRTEPKKFGGRGARARYQKSYR
ncbi:hypothetical protein APSETT445_008639 [Aspergillus pseudonomiae]